ncbi:SMODS domain-containing nucleotidyltransferase [Pyxidicoccus sp. 3LFB2]
MWSVAEALERFIQSLELTEKQKEEVIRQHTMVREKLRQLLKSKTDFLSGSYSRNTAIRPLHDIDLFVVLGVAASPPPPPTLDSLFKQSAQGLTPDAVLKLVRQALKDAWPNKDLARLQHHSVNTGFRESGIDFDVVPAYELPDQEGYLIPERQGGQWIRTNPRLHQQLSTEANERSGKKLKPLLKAVKRWNGRQDSSPLRSFHLEAMSYDALPSAMQGYLEPLEVLFAQLARKVLLPCPDPAGLGPNVDARMSGNQREAARQLLASAANEVRLAREESTSRPEQAHARLRKLFGDEYRDR